MPSFSKRSIDRLFTCDALLINLFIEVIKYRDCKIIWGHRNEKEQNDLYNEVPPKTQLPFPRSDHNVLPSMAVDVLYLPFNNDWDNREPFQFFRGQVYMIAKQLEINLKPAIGWDLMHFALRG